MAGRGPQTFKKRQKEQQRKEKQEEKRARRLQRKLEGPRDPDAIEPGDDDLDLEGVEGEGTELEPTLAETEQSQASS